MGREIKLKTVFTAPPYKDPLLIGILRDSFVDNVRSDTHHANPYCCTGMDLLLRLTVSIFRTDGHPFLRVDEMCRFKLNWKIRRPYTLLMRAGVTDDIHMQKSQRLIISHRSIRRFYMHRSQSRSSLGHQ